MASLGVGTLSGSGPLFSQLRGERLLVRQGFFKGGPGALVEGASRQGKNRGVGLGHAAGESHGAVHHLLAGDTLLDEAESKKAKSIMRHRDHLPRLEQLLQESQDERQVVENYHVLKGVIHK